MLSDPDGAVEVTSPGFTRGSFADTVALTRGASRHPFAGGIRALAVAARQLTGASGFARQDCPATFQPPASLTSSNLAA